MPPLKLCVRRNYLNSAFVSTTGAVIVVVVCYYWLLRFDSIARFVHSCSFDEHAKSPSNLF